LVIVENDYVEPVDRARLVEGAIKGMVAELDPHSSYLPARDYALFQGDTQGEFGGVGVEVDFRQGQVTVIAPIEGSPADRAGIRPGDRIVSIDKFSVQGQSAAELVRRMRGKPGTEVTLTVRRDENDALLRFTLRREVIEVASVAGELLDGEIAYIRLKQFQRGSHDEFMATIAKVREQGHVSALILDLRNNPGGLVDEAASIADELLPSGVIYTTRHREKTVDEVKARRGGVLSDPPMVTLINEYSASAAELIAGALQDHGRSTLVGTPTFGKGSVQSIVDLPDGAGLRLTTMRYYTPKGRSIQAQGIQPDVLVAGANLTDQAYGVIREHDLDNHLPAEGKLHDRGSKTPAPPPSPVPPATEPTPQEAESAIGPTHMGVARKIPKNPTNSPDLTLAEGYRLILAKLASRSR
jgi:carboxyl-terminal processing protease